MRRREDEGGGRTSEGRENPAMDVSPTLRRMSVSSFAIPVRTPGRTARCAADRRTPSRHRNATAGGAGVKLERMERHAGGERISEGANSWRERRRVREKMDGM